jgi:adenosylhomocysteinase
MSFADQLLSVEYLVTGKVRLEKKVHAVPREIDTMVAELKLSTMGVKIDQLTEKQKHYLASWEEGT